MAEKDESGRDESDLAYAGWLCPECQYDLRGLREAVCPECGTEFECRPRERLWLRRLGGFGSLATSVITSSLGLVIGFVGYSDFVRNAGSRCVVGSGFDTFFMVLPVVFGLAIACLVIAKRLGFRSLIGRVGVTALGALWTAGLMIILMFG